MSANPRFRDDRRGIQNCVWIPAFAGMTVICTRHTDRRWSVEFANSSVQFGAYLWRNKVSEFGRTTRFKGNFSKDRGLVASGVLCVVFGSFVILMAVWDVLPNWIPIPGGYIVGIRCCCGLCLLGPYYGFSIGTVLAAVWRIFGRLSENDFYGVVTPTVVLFVVLFLAIVLHLGTDDISQALLNYGIRRYDRVVEAIEQYKLDHGFYPESLDALTPNYLQSKPGIFLKYGERLDYAPDTWSGDDAPFRFELYGHDSSGVHGRILKYCPVEFECPDGDRINDRWMWTYSSAL